MTEDSHEHFDPDRSTDDPQAVSTVLTGVVSVVLLGVLIIALEALHLRATEAERYHKVISQQPQELRQVQAEQMEKLNGYRWVDKTQGVVAIPIDRAMRIVVEDSRASGRGRAAAR